MPETLTLERVAELRAKAEKASPGPWTTESFTFVRGGSRGFDMIATTTLSYDAAHIAACDPPTVLALIAMVERYRAALEWTVKIADANYEQDDKLRSQGARTLIRISDRATSALAHPTGDT